MLQDLTVNIIAGILAGIVVTYLHVYLIHQDRDLGRKELILDIKNKALRSPLVVFIYALALLQVAWSIITLALIPLTRNTWIEDAQIGEVSFIIFILLVAMGITMVFISIYMHHRLSKSRLSRNVLLVVATYTLAVTEASIVVDSFPTLRDAGLMLIMLGITSSILLPAIYLGRYLAKKTQPHYTMQQLFKHLSDQDKKDLIEIVDSLPSVKGKN